jgi:haloacetate dehalogenase
VQGLLLRRPRGQTETMFDGFTQTFIEVDGARILARHGGSGPALLLLHGHPRTSATWHRVAPLLVASGYTVVCADLRGYGRSTGPEPTADHSAHSKRAVAADMVAVMHELGHDRFSVVGHDRGSLVALRLALDHPDTVEDLIVIDCLPVTEHLSRADAEFALRWWHWFFFAQPDIPERVITADPDRWYRGDPAAMGQENYDEWRAAMRDPSVVRAMLEDYRAGVSVDAADEAADRWAGRMLEMPVLVLWTLRDDLEELYGDPLVIWRDWATDARGHGIDSGHHVAEEAPDELAEAIDAFVRAHLRSVSGPE